MRSRLCRCRAPGWTRIALRGLLAVALLLPSSHAEAGAGRGAPALRHPALGVLAQAFREEDAEVLRPLLQGAKKLYVVSPSLGLRKGYYSPDQIYLIFRDLFRTHTSVEFRLMPSGSAGLDQPELIVIGYWTFRQGPSAEKHAALSLTLARRPGGWDLREIREVP